MKAFTPIKRKTPLRSHAVLSTSLNRKAKFPTRNAPKDAGAARAFKRDVLARANNQCEVGPVLAASTHPKAALVGRKCRGRAHTAHHRQPRGMGGHGDNSPENGVAVCTICHLFIESYRTIAYELGLLERH